MLSFPNCKINIGLSVVNRRDDGFHNLETIFYPLTRLHDALEIIPSQQPALYPSGKTVVGEKEDNLVWKAYQLLRNAFSGIIGDLDIHLLKAIPMGAGLGGGSSDAAFMLRLLNEYFELGLEREELIEYALQLGSDCPVFIYNTPQFARGRGEIMTPIAIDLSNYSMKLVCPDVHIATAKAFQMIKPQKPTFDLSTLPALPIAEWRDYVHNDFETPIFGQYPQLADIKQQLYNQGALYAAMSGTGSSLYGIFPKLHHVEILSSLPIQTFYFE